MLASLGRQCWSSGLNTLVQTETSQQPLGGLIFCSWRMNLNKVPDRLTFCQAPSYGQDLCLSSTWATLLKYQSSVVPFMKALTQKKTKKNNKKKPFKHRLTLQASAEMILADVKLFQGVCVRMRVCRFTLWTLEQRLSSFVLLSCLCV